ncbi:MAG: mechanosensitive ion channel family protein [Fimbriimonadaceae bacterium]|jgi:MscS family membrane protein|nr:mechanosensitive ion channel family protein [Fimbriimonadaceae bacterium]
MKHFLYGLTALLVLLFAVPGLAQLPPPPATPTVSPEFQSPRATLNAYFQAMDRNDFAKAQNALDLSDFPPLVRQEEGRRTATLLLAILNRIERIDLSQVSESTSEASPYIARELTIPGTGEKLGDLVMTKTASGWKISAETVRLLPDWWVRVTDLPVVTGLREINEEEIQPEKNLKKLVPADWQRPLLGLAVWQWIFVGGLLLLSSVISGIVWFLAKPILKTWRREGSEEWRRANGKIRRGGSVIIFLSVIRLGWPWLGFPVFVDFIVFFVLAISFSAAWLIFLFALLDAFLFSAVRRSNDREERTRKIIVPVVGKLGRFFIAVGVILLLLSHLGLNVWGVIAGLGIGGLVVALAAKDSVENLFGSVTILLEMPFGIGDWVKIGDVEGEVEEINLRSTRIRTFADSIVVLPNSRLITASVENMGMRRFRRFRTSFTISADCSADQIERFCQTARDYLESRSDIPQGRHHLRLNDFSETGLVIFLVCYFQVPDYVTELAAREEIIETLLRLMADEGLTLAALDRKFDLHARP